MTNLANEQLLRDRLLHAIQQHIGTESLTRGKIIELTGSEDVCLDDIRSGKTFLFSTEQLVRTAQRLEITKQLVTNGESYFR